MYQPQYQPHQQYTGVPPAKRLKTAAAAVVTRYAPPPSYAAPYGVQAAQQGWQQNGFTGYQGSAYQSGAGYPPQHQQSQYSGSMQSPHAGMYTAPSVQGYQTATQHGYPGSDGWSSQGYPPQSQWPVQSQAQYPPQNQPFGSHVPAQQFQQQVTYSAQNATAALAAWSPQLSTSQDSTKTDMIPNGKFQGVKRSLSATHSTTAESAPGDDEPPAHEFDETDYQREVSFAKDQVGFTDELSIGITIYRAARPVKTALLATYAEAELELIAASIRPDEDESISRYFTKSAIAQVETRIQDSSDWEKFKKDFVIHPYGPASSAHYTPVKEVIAGRDRPDRAPEASDNTSRSTGSELGIKPPANDPASSSTERSPVVKHEQAVPEARLIEPREEAADEDDDAMDMEESDSEDEGTLPKAEQAVTGSESSTHVAVNEERVNAVARSTASAQVDSKSANPQVNGSHATSSSRGLQPFTPTTSSNESLKSAVGQPVGHASSGLAQSPRDVRHHFDHRMPYGPHNVPPPPMHDGGPTAWRTDSRHETQLHSDSPHSASSQFGLDKPDSHGTEDPPHGSAAKRKRETDEDRDSGHERRRQHDDATPRLRGYRPKVPDAYSRRYR